MRSSLFAVLAVVALAPTLVCADRLRALSSVSFCVVDIGRPPGTTPQEVSPNVFAMNNRNEIVGTMGTSQGTTQAFIWSRRAAIHMAGALPDTELSTFTDINDFGRAVGDSNNSDLYLERAIVWDPRNGMRTIDIGSSNSALSAYGINVFGQIAGSGIIDGNRHAYLRQPNGRVIDLGEGGATEINDLGQVIGGGNAGGLFIWDRWRGRRALDFGPGVSAAYVLDINNWAVVVGDASVVFGDAGEAHTRAFRWTERNGFQDLGSLAGDHPLYQFAGATEINDWGYIVGISQIETGEGHAFLWHKSTKMRDLNDLLDPTSSLAATTVLVIAKAINDRGHIAAEGYDTRELSAWRAYFLSPRFDESRPCE